MNDRCEGSSTLRSTLTGSRGLPSLADTRGRGKEGTMIRLQRVETTDRGDTYYRLSDGTRWLRTSLFEDPPGWDKGTWLRVEPTAPRRGVGTTHVLVAHGSGEEVEVALAEEAR